MPNLPQLEQPESLAKLAYNALRESILSGQMSAGAVYNEKVLAKGLGISRTPVREALIELASQGLVTFLPRKGVVVNEFTSRDIEEIFELRKAIELAAVEKIAKFGKLKELTRLEKNVAAQRKATEMKNIPEYMALDRSFHMLLSELTGNLRLLQTMQNIRDMVHLMGLRALTKQRGRVEEVLEEHEKVLDAIRQGNAVEARALMAHHLDRSKEAVEHTHS